MLSYTTQSEAETESAGMAFARTLERGAVIAMEGDLGAGKTCFVRGMAAELVPGCRVSSPTYALVNEYRANSLTVYHFDMYRITTPDELYSAGFYDYLDHGAVIIIEWYENIRAFFHDITAAVRIKKDEKDENLRFIEIEYSHYD